MVVDMIEYWRLPINERVKLNKERWFSIDHDYCCKCGEKILDNEFLFVSGDFLSTMPEKIHQRCQRSIQDKM